MRISDWSSDVCSSDLHLGEAHHRQLLRVVPGLEAGRAHRIAADAGELRVREARAQLFDQSRAEQVAGGFAGAKRDALWRWIRDSGFGVRQGKGHGRWAPLHSAAERRVPYPTSSPDRKSTRLNSSH